MSYKNPSRKCSLRLSTSVRLGVAAVAACFIVAPVLSNPVNPTVVNGTASFSQAGNVLTVTNSNGAIINWDKFSIKAGETTHFAQTSASSSVLNRVLNDPTAIYGTLSSNGRVWLVNPAGIMVGPGGRVDTAAFVASTLAVRNEDFLAGRNLFVNDGSARDILNQGEIRTPAGGSVYLIGSNVGNEGIITTPKGETILAAGATVSLIDSATPGVKVDITGATGNSTNLGEITAEAGRIGIAGVIVRNSGQLNASSVVSEGGRIFLKASRDAYIDGNGRIVTTGTKGGRVEVLGDRVAVMDQASVDVSGINGGGRILVGGDYQGKNPDIQNASITYFGPDATLKADATEVGAGGTVIVWADDTARAYGSISARGGAMGGNGGFVETSGHRYLDVAGARIDTRAPSGKTGDWLLDPADITIVHSTGSVLALGSDTFAPGGATSTTSDFDINNQLATTNVTIQTYGGSGGYGDITINPGVAIHNGANNPSFSLEADRDISIYGSTIMGGSSTYKLGIHLTAQRNVFIKDSVLETYGGDMSISAVNITLTGDTGYGAIASTAGCAVPGVLSCQPYSGTFVFGGLQTITATNLLKLEAPAAGGLGVGLVSGGGQNITADSIEVLGGVTGQNNGAHIVNYSTANQTVQAHSILIKAGGSNATDFNDGASISSYGNQVITITGGGSITLYGGAGGADVAAYGGIAGANYGSECVTYGGDINYCYTSSNRAEIAHSSDAGYGQTIAFSGGPGSISLYGGSSGAGNSAEIKNDSNTYGASPGAQLIGSASYGANIYIQGGSSGGKAVYGSNGKFYDERNGAGIEGDSNMTVYAGTITLVGGGGTGAVTGAIIGGGADAGGGTMNIYTTGDVSLTGGSSPTVAAFNNGAKLYDLTAPAAIGSDKDITINLNVGGNLSLSGGSGTGSGALVGSLDGVVTIVAQVSGNVGVTANAGTAGIGALHGYGGSVAIYGAQDITFGDNTGITNGPGYTPTAATNIKLLAKRNIDLGLSSNDAYGGNVQVIAGWDGNMVTPGVYGGPLTDGNLTMTGAAIQTRNAANMDVRAYGDLAMTSVDSASANLWIQNSSGGNTMNVSAGHDISLTAAYGSNAFISMVGGGTQTIAAGGALTLNGASGSFSPNYGGAAFINAGNTSLNTTLQHVTAHQISLLAGGSATSNNKGSSALIQAYGPQVIDITGTGGGITLTGNGGASGSDNYAIIRQLGSTGSQSITFYGSGANLLVTGGSGAGTAGTPNSACASDPDGCGSQTMSSNVAGIENQGSGSQTLSFNGTGGSIALYGGSAGVRNTAFMYSPNGAQQISGAPAITLTGGSSGGSGFQAADGNHYLSNHAVIYSQYGAQTINAASLTLNGVVGGASAGTYGGAGIEGSTQAITVYGSTTLTAGGTSRAGVHIISHGNQSLMSASLALQAGDDGHGNKAIVVGNGTQSIVLTGSGDVLTLTGGSGAASYDNYAQIQQLASAGSQTIALTGASGGNIVITGGSGGGTGGAAPNGCAAAVSGDPCYGADIAHNNAGLYSTGTGGQSVSFSYGGALSLYGGSVGNRNNAFIQSLYGGQAISGNAAITLVGGTSGGAWVPNPYGGSYLGNGAGIRSEDPTVAQSIYGSSITLKGNGAGAAANTVAGASIRALGSGGQTVFATGAVTLTGGSATYGGVGIISTGPQTFTAQSFGAYGGTGGHDNAAVLSAYGGQTVTLTGSGDVLTLAGGGGTNPDGYNNYAEIRQLSLSSGQSINLTGSGANVVLQGGSGNGLLGEMESDCVAGVGAALCQASYNKATIENRGSGGQTLSYVYGGGSLQIYGGDTGYRNHAGLDNSNNVSTVGVQQILGAPNILIQGGTSGGRMVLPSASAKPFFIANEAGIFSDNTQTIYAGTLTMVGGSGASTVSPAVLSAPTQIINATGAITLQGGSGSAASVAYGGSFAPAAPWSQLATGAVIGVNDKSKGNVTIKGGSIAATTGAGTSGSVMIGSLEYGADVQLGAYGDIVLQANAAPLNIGSGASAAPTSYGGVTVTIDAGNDLLIDALGSGQVSIGATNILATDTASISLSAGRHLAINGTGSGPVLIGTATAATPVNIVAGKATNGVLAVANAGYGGNLTIGANTTVSAYGASASLVGTHGVTYGGDIILSSGSAVYGGGYVDVIAGGNETLAGTLQTNVLATGGIRAQAGAGTVGTANGYGGNLTVSGNLSAYGGSAVNLELTSFGGTANAGTLTQTAGNLYGGGFALTSYGAMGLAGNASTDALGIGLIRAGYQGAGWRNVPVALTVSGAISGGSLTVGSSGDVSLTGPVTSGAAILTVTAGDFTAGTGGDITLGSNTLSGYGGVTLTANHGSGANGDITQAASGTIVGVGNPSTSTVNIYAGGNLTLGAVQAVTSISTASGSTSGGTANGYGGSSSLLGNLSAGSISVRAHGGSNYGGDLTSAAGTTMTSTATAQTVTVRGDGDVGLSGNIVAPTGSVAVSSGYTGAAGKFTAINVIDTGAGTVNVTATGPILDNNGVGVTNITANSVLLSSVYGGASGGLAISSDIAGSSSITASVAAGATYGGIYIRDSGSSVPTTIALADAASYQPSATFYYGGNLALGAGHTFTAGSGNIAITSGGLMSGIETARFGGTPASIQLVAQGGDMSLSNTLGSVGNIRLAAGGVLDIGYQLSAADLTLAGSTINISGPATATGDVAIGGGVININSGVAGQNVVLGTGSLNIGNTGGTGGISAVNHLLAVVSGSANIAGGYLTTGNGDLELLVGGSLNLGNASYGGYIWAGYNNNAPYPDVSIAVGGDLRLNNGGHIDAANDVYLDLLGASSKLVLNDGTAGYAPSYVLTDIGTGVAATTHLTFLNRSSGGVVINGTETTTSVPGGSGFFAVNTDRSTPAAPVVTFAIQAQDSVAAQLTNDIVKAADEVKSTETPTDSDAPPPLEFTKTDPTQPPVDLSKTVGNTEGTFGGESGGSGTGGDTNGTTPDDQPPATETKKEEGPTTTAKDEKTDDKKDEKDEKDEKDKKKSDEAKEEKKDDKPAQKKVAQCSS